MVAKTRENIFELKPSLKLY